MMKNSNLVSVIIPVFNVEKYLEKCVNSVINQSYQKVEVLLIDDGSTDRSGIICDNFAIKDSRVKVFHCENGGVSKARNIGLLNCSGNYVAFLDSDDWLDINLFSKLMGDIANRPVDIFTYDSVNVREDGNTQKRNFWSSFSEGEIVEGQDIYRKVFCRSAWITNKLFSAHVLKDVFFDEKMTYAEDVYFLCGVLKKVNNVRISNFSGYFRLIRDGMASSSISLEKNLEYISNNYVIYDELHRIGFGDVGIYRLFLVLSVLAKKQNEPGFGDVFKVLKKTIRKTSFSDRLKFLFSPYYGKREKICFFSFFFSYKFWKRLYI